MNINISQHQLKVLILYTLESFGSPMPMTALEQTLELCDVNSFYIKNCIYDLVEMGHCIIVDEFVMLSEVGEKILEQLKKDVPLSIRQKASKEAVNVLANLRKSLSVKVEILPANEYNEASYICNATLFEDEQTLLKLSMYTPTKLQAEMMMKNFKENPTEIYKSILSVLIDKKIEE